MERFSKNNFCLVLMVFLEVLAFARTAATGDCSNFPDGSAFPITGYDNQYYICINGSAKLSSCPTGLIFDPVSTNCVNPCSRYDPLPYVDQYYVASRDETSYYNCLGNGTMTRQQCPEGTQFHQALGSLKPPAFCLRQSDLDKLCPFNSYMVMPLIPNESCSFISLTPYYMICNDGRANIQRCPLNWISSSNGYCLRTNFYCEQTGSTTNAMKCICE